MTFFSSYVPKCREAYTVVVQGYQMAAGGRCGFLPKDRRRFLNAGRRIATIPKIMLRSPQGNWREQFPFFDAKFVALCLALVRAAHFCDQRTGKVW